jgi:hypothetical protein
MLCRRSVLALLLLTASLSAWSTDTYWNYKIKDIDVT